jgi:hypothetical protein
LNTAVQHKSGLKSGAEPSLTRKLAEDEVLQQAAYSCVADTLANATPNFQSAEALPFNLPIMQLSICRN